MFHWCSELRKIEHRVSIEHAACHLLRYTAWYFNMCIWLSVHQMRDNKNDIPNPKKTKFFERAQLYNRRERVKGCDTIYEHFQSSFIVSYYVEEGHKLCRFSRRMYRRVCAVLARFSITALVKGYVKPHAEVFFFEIQQACVRKLRESRCGTRRRSFVNQWAYLWTGVGAST